MCSCGRCRASSRRTGGRQVIIIGDDGPGYGLKPPNGKTWRTYFLDEVAESIDPARVHFVGRLPYQRYLKALQVSSAHVYLTYPFVLSWSLLEAMSAGCVVIGSDTAPVREVIDGENGMLVPFFDTDALAERVVEALAKPKRFETMRKAARQTVEDNFDTEKTCLPRMLAILKGEDAGAARRLVEA